MFCGDIIFSNKPNLQETVICVHSFLIYCPTGVSERSIFYKDGPAQILELRHCQYLLTLSDLTVNSGSFTRVSSCSTSFHPVHASNLGTIILEQNVSLCVCPVLLFLY